MVQKTIMDTRVDSLKSSVAEGDQSLGAKLHAELGLLASIPAHIGQGAVSRLQDVLEHKDLTGIELAASFGVAAALTAATKNPGLLGDFARITPKLFLGLTALDIGRRFGGPMLDTWQHPANAERNKEWLGDNLGAALVDYPLVAAAGYAGDRLSAGLLKRIGAPESLTESSVPTLKDILSKHGRILGRHSLNVPVVIGMETLEQKLYPDGGIFPFFPVKIIRPDTKTFVDLQSDQAASVIPKSGFKLSQPDQTGDFGIHLDKDGPVRLDLTMAAPGTNWGKLGAESAVASVYLDGKYNQDVVLFGGSDKTKYGLALDNLTAGNHTISLRYAAEKSPHGAQGIAVDSGTATTYSYADKLTEAVDENAPVLYGRHGIDNNQTDTPMSMYHYEQKNADGSTTINYGYVFSNEDGGTGILPSVLNARWGRMTDIQDVFRVKVDASGKVLLREYQGPNHIYKPFAGTLEGTHPVILTITDNNNVFDAGTGPIKFRMNPDYAAPKDAPIEELQKENPLWWKVSSIELDRERKISRLGSGDLPNDGVFSNIVTWFKQHALNAPPQLADPRDYVYVQMNLKGASQDPVAARITFKNGRTSVSDFGFAGVAISRNGWSQTSVLLPAGTKASDVSGLDFIGRGSGGAQVLGVGHIYTLDKSYVPQELKMSTNLNVK